jgi:phage terminase large subunit-like protein
MPSWSTACPDWERRVLAGESLIPFDPLFPEEAAAAMAVFTSLRIVDAAGSPTIGEAAPPWMLDFARAIFGSYDAASGRRLIRDYFLLISKKNGKSTLAAAIMLTTLIRNWRASGEFYILSPTIEVANNSYLPARDMVRADEELSDLLHVQDHLRTITHRGNSAFLKVVAADSDTISGKKAIGLLVDEVWAFGKRANAENMLREARGGLASRPEGFEIDLSTQSDAPPAGLFAQRLARFRDIRDGVPVDPRSLGVLYEYPPQMLKDESFRDPKNFYVTNPSLGVSVDLEYLVDEYKKAEHAGDASFRGFAAKHLDVQLGIALRSDGWAGAPLWERGADPELTLDALLERSEVVTVGVDGGGLEDLLGVAVLGREKDTKNWLLWAHAFVSPEGMERRKANASVYQNFIDDGDLTLVDELPDDVAGVVEIVGRVNDAGRLHMVGVDAAGIDTIVDGLAEIDISQENENLTAVRQGIALMGAIKTIERRLADGSFRHSGSRMMSWMVGNLKVVPTPTAMRLARDESGYGKIDAMAAAFNAAALMCGNPDSLVSPYETRGILII